MKKNRLSRNLLEGPKSGWYWGGIAALCCLLLGCIMLFGKKLGVADDGTLSRVLEGAGLSYPDGVTGTPDYFQRNYVWAANTGTGYHSLQTIVIWLAKMLDYAFTGNRMLDIRFLGAVYLLCFLPAICLLVKAAADRLQTFPQKCVITAAAVLIFADVGYLTYFNSFYSEALVFICILYMAGAAMNLQNKTGYEMFYLLVFTFAAAALCFVRRYCFLAGIVGAVFCLSQRFRIEGVMRRAGVFVLSAVLAAASVTSLFLLEDDFRREDKFHAMSRGVLIQAENPEEALKEFGIDPSWSLVSEVSAYDPFPLVAGGDEVLDEGFFDKYTSLDITRYYLRHPAQMASMVDAAVKSNLEVRRTSCGNFEKSKGMPKGSRSIFWSAYSIFKNRSAPKTIGYLVVLVLVSAALTANGFSLKKEKNRKNSVYLQVIAAFGVLTVLQTCFIIIRSGEPALIQYNGQLGMVLDVLLFFTVTEVLERLKIL